MDKPVGKTSACLREAASAKAGATRLIEEYETFLSPAGIWMKGKGRSRKFGQSFPIPYFSKHSLINYPAITNHWT